MAAWDELPAAGGLGECAALVRSAEALRFTAPELAVQLARRALALGAVGPAAGTAGRPGDLVAGVVGQDTGEGRALSMRAHAVLAAGLVRVSHYADAVEPAFVALALAEGGGMTELAASMRLDLAACAREVGEPLLGCALLRPVLETGQPQPSVRAVALGRLVGCTAHVGRRDDVEDALAEAERLLASDSGLSQDASRLERARLSLRSAAYHRWYGDTEDAVEAAREGLGQLNRLHGRRPETDRLRAQLVLELVCALLDEGELGEAESASVALLAEPVRATSAAAIGQLMLALSTRVHLPSGRVDRGRGLLDQAVWVGDRHGLDGLLVDALTAVSELDERAGRTLDALEALRTARAAEQRKLRAVAKAARQILAVVGAAKDWDTATATALLRATATPARPRLSSVRSLPSPQPQPQSQPEPATETDAATGLLNKEGLLRRLRAVRNGERPVALTLVRLDEFGTKTNIDLTALAGRVRDLAPDDAELARSDGTELAVLLPHTTRDQAEEFAQSIRRSALESNWLSQTNARSISTGVGQSNPDAPSVDARALLTAARHALTPAESTRRPGERTRPVHATAMTAEALSDLEDVGDTLRIGRSIISSLSISAGSGGKRRAPTGTHPTLPPDHQPTPQPNHQATPQSNHPPTPHSPPATPHPAAVDAPENRPDLPATDEPVTHRASGWATGETSVSHETSGRSGAERFASHQVSGWSAEDGSAAHQSYDSSSTEGSAAHQDFGSPSSAEGWAAQQAPGSSVEGGSAVHQPPGLSSATGSAAHQAPDWSTGSGSGGHRSSASSAADGLSAHQALASAADSFDAYQGSDSPAAESAAAQATPDVSSGSAFSTPRLDPDEQQASASARHAAPDSSPSASHAAASSTGETPDPYGAAEPASPDPTAEPSRAVGETGGYRPLISFRSEQPPEPAEPEETSAARGYRSSYEETRAELARLMSVLESGSLPADSLPESVGDSPSPSGSNPPPTADVADASEPSSGSRSADSSTEPAESSAGTGGESSPWAGGRWSFAPVGESASLPTPTRPGDDYAHHASASIPNPPEPDEVPEPRRRPEVPDPGEPDPIPPAPPDPGPIPPDEPGPPPPSDSDTTTGTGTTGFSTGGAGRRERSSGSSTIAGLLAEAFAAYQETSPDDESSRQATGDTEASSFDRLFDWRYQSPESGRHRSPE